MECWLTFTTGHHTHKIHKRGNTAPDYVVRTQFSGKTPLIVHKLLEYSYFFTMILRFVRLAGAGARHGSLVSPTVRSLLLEDFEVTTNIMNKIIIQRF